MIKRKEELWFDFFIVVPQGMTKENLIEQTSASIRVKDIKAKYLDPDRYEKMGNFLSFFGLLMFGGFLTYVSVFLPIEKGNLFQDKGEKPWVIQGSTSEHMIKVCAASRNPIYKASCKNVTVQELADFEPAKDLKGAYFANRKGVMPILTIILIVIGAYLYSGGWQLVRSTKRILKRLLD